MKHKIVYYICFFTLFLISWGLLTLIAQDLSQPIKGMISAAVAAILSPRVKVIQTASGEHHQMTWLFWRKAKTY